MKTIVYLLFVLFLSCSNSDDFENGITFYWEQTGCVDPWKTGPNNTHIETSEALETYLKGEGISAIDVVGFEDTLEEGVYTCYACHCKTGIRIYVEVPVSEVEKMAELGFKRK